MPRIYLYDKRRGNKDVACNINCLCTQCFRVDAAVGLLLKSNTEINLLTHAVTKVKVQIVNVISFNDRNVLAIVFMV